MCHYVAVKWYISETLKTRCNLDSGGNSNLLPIFGKDFPWAKTI